MANECHYTGFKIHTRSHNWDLQDERICKLMDEICEYASSKIDIVSIFEHEFCRAVEKRVAQNSELTYADIRVGKSLITNANTSHNKLTFPILIHCGEDDFENPKKFEKWFMKFPEAQFVLAHSRPCGDTIAMLQKYKNVFCDTAFSTTETVATICNAGFSDRILFGTDFPITHYKDFQEKSISVVPKTELLLHYRKLQVAAGAVMETSLCAQRLFF